MKRPSRTIVAGALALLPMGLAGCAVGHLIGGMLQNEEYQKLLEVHPKYSDLENQRVAVVVDADMDLMFQHPKLEPRVKQPAFQLWLPVQV